ncbi:IS110 family transposase [Loktanella sp. SALINAS62]|nr:IS110 family transposase [Loktanella sp. SALINAS62]
MRTIPGIGPVSAAMLIAELPQLGRMTSGERVSDLLCNWDLVHAS